MITGENDAEKAGREAEWRSLNLKFLVGGVISVMLVVGTLPVMAGLSGPSITVDGGYKPSRVVVQAGLPVQLNFLCRDPSSCLEKVVLPDFHIATDLDLSQVTPIKFTPEKPGEYPFTCVMNMFRGVVEVQGSGATNRDETALIAEPVPVNQVN